MISPNQIRANDYRYQDLLTKAAEARLIASAIDDAPTTIKPSSVSRISACARRALAALASLSFASGDNTSAAA